MIECAIFTLLSADAGIAAAIAGGIWPMLMPELVDYPALSYFLVDTPAVQTLIEPSGLAHPRFQINAWSNEYLSAKRAIEAVRAALDGFMGTVTTPDGDVAIRGIRWEDGRDGYEKETRTFHAMHDFIVWYRCD